MRGAGRELAGQRTHAVATVGQQRERRAPRQALALHNRAKPASRLLILAADEAEIPVVATRGQRFADHDLEVVFLVVPVADVAAIEADDDRSLRDRPRRALGGTARDVARLPGAELGFMPGGDPVQGAAEGRGV